jgi:alkylmercury lyase
MTNEKKDQLTERLAAVSGFVDYGAERSRLLIQVWQAVATGKPVTTQQVDAFVSGFGIAPEEADQFLRQMTERNDDDSIVGIMGLSQNDHPHKFTVGGVQMSTWCAADTLFLPAMLGRTATIESASPESKETVRLTVGPDGVQTLEPSGAVISFVLPEETNMTSVASIWMTFCSHIFFFASHSEAEQWANGRDDIRIMPVEQGFEITMQLWEGVRSYAKELPAGAVQG